MYISGIGGDGMSLEDAKRGVWFSIKKIQQMKKRKLFPLAFITGMMIGLIDEIIRQWIVYTK